MQEPAKAPLERTCQVSAMKHVSIVYQFQSICSGRAHRQRGEAKEQRVVVWGSSLTEILHPLPMPSMLMGGAELLAAGMAAVAVGLMAIVPVPMSILTGDSRWGFEY